jgi:lipopolysaccharide export system protein LptC
MNTSGAALFPTLILALLAGLTFWLERATEAPPAPVDRVAHEVDYFVTGLRYRHYGDSGDLRQTLNASRLEHFRDDETTAVMTPQVIYSAEGTIIASADAGTIDHDGSHVRLLDNVRVIHAPHGPGAETIITTSELDAYPDERKLHTRAAVRIAQAGSTVTGTGLEADGRGRVTVLGGPVHGVLERRR